MDNTITFKHGRKQQTLTCSAYACKKREGRVKFLVMTPSPIRGFPVKAKIDGQECSIVGICKLDYEQMADKQFTLRIVAGTAD